MEEGYPDEEIDPHEDERVEEEEEAYLEAHLTLGLPHLYTIYTYKNRPIFFMKM